MDRPNPGVGVFVLRAGKVLLLKRRGSHGAGTWSVPGGWLERGETPEECAVREVREETGIEIARLRRGPYTNNLFPEGIHSVTLFVLSDWARGEPRICEPEKCTELGWFSWDALPMPLFLPIELLREMDFDPNGR